MWVVQFAQTGQNKNQQHPRHHCPAPMRKEYLARLVGKTQEDISSLAHQFKTFHPHYWPKAWDRALNAEEVFYALMILHQEGHRETLTPADLTRVLKSAKDNVGREVPGEMRASRARKGHAYIQNVCSDMMRASIAPSPRPPVVPTTSPSFSEVGRLAADMVTPANTNNSLAAPSWSANTEVSATESDEEQDAEARVPSRARRHRPATPAPWADGGNDQSIAEMLRSAERNVRAGLVLSREFRTVMANLTAGIQDAPTDRRLRFHNSDWDEDYEPAD